jgi:hypothetical protein
MLDLNQTTVLSGFLSTFIVFLITIIYQRRFDTKDVGSFAAAFIAGSNIPPAIFLCLYGIYPDPSTVQTKLHGYEKYVSLAGLLFLVIATLTLWNLIKRAYEKDQE